MRHRSPVQFSLTSQKNNQNEVIIIGTFEKGKNTHLSKPEKLILNQIIHEKIFECKKNQSHFVLNTQHPHYIFLGLGNAKDLSFELIRKQLSQVLQTNLYQFKKIQIDMESFCTENINLDSVLEECVLIPRMSLYRFDEYQSKKEIQKPIAFELYHSGLKKKSSFYQKILQQTQTIADGICLSRDLGNHPGNIMTPHKLNQTAQQIAKDCKYQFESLNLKQLKQKKMGGILSVSQGSHHPPYLYSIRKKATNPKSKTIVIVGKGVTFDTGGTSLKPSATMDEMKFDMCGAAIVTGLMKAISKLSFNVHVIGIVPTAENHIALDPQRPGDIITTYSGKTVEVLNTDAEGRLILADAFTYAKKFKPDYIIDLATLTGAIVATLADKAAGIFTNNDSMAQSLIESGQVTGEKLWQMPLWEEYEEMIKSKIADIKNLGGSYAGSITAAAFLKEFIPEKTPWCHIDIAGVSWNVKGRKYFPEGASGFGIRLLINYLKNLQ